MRHIAETHIQSFRRELARQDRAPGTIENYLRHVRAMGGTNPAE